MSVNRNECQMTYPKFRPPSRFHTPHFLKELEKTEKAERHPIFQKVKKAMAVVALSAVTLAGIGTNQDIQHNISVTDHAEVSISVLSSAMKPEDSDTAIIFFNGFGTNDGEELIKDIGPSVQSVIDGQEWSVGYNNAPLSTKSITSAITNRAGKDGIKDVIMVGYSTGGILAIEAADELVNETNIHVEQIIAISTPDGYDGLRPARQAEIGALKTVAAIPFAEYSTPVRFFAEMYFRRSQFTRGNVIQNIFDAAALAPTVLSDLNKKDVPGTRLLVDQGFAIINANLQRNITDIGTAPSTKLKPDIEYLGTATPGYDYMVNNKLSSENICIYALSQQLKCQIDNVPGAVHTRPDLSKDEYEKTMQAASKQIHAALTDNLSQYSLDNLRILTPLKVRH